MIQIPFPVVISIALPLWIWLRLRHFDRSTDVSLYREVLVNLFFVYGSAVFIVTMRPFYFQLPWLGPNEAISFDFQLFEEMRNMAAGSESLQLYYLIGNVVLLIPFGFLLPLVFPFARHFLITVIFGFSLSLTIEVTQVLFTLTRRGTIDDLVINTIGAMIGYVLFRIVQDLKFSRRTS